MTAEFKASVYVTPRNRANFRRLKTNSIQSVKRWEKENELLYAMMEDESEWLAKLFPDVVISPEFFFYALEDGSLLCRLANYIQEKAEIYGQNHNITVPGKKFRYHSMSKCSREIKLFRSRENVQQFLTWCRSHGIPEAILFESNDVVQVDECREGCRGVIICLMEIVRRTLKFELDELPQLIQMEKEIEDEEARSETDPCLNEHEQVLDVEKFNSDEIEKLDVHLTEPEIQSPNSLDSDSGVESVFDQDEGENSASRLTEFAVEETVETSTRSTTTRKHVSTIKPKKDPKTAPKGNDPKGKKDLPSLLESTEPKTELEKQICKIAQDYNVKLVHRLKEGKYIILGRIMFVRMLNDHLLVRIGGGWDTLEHYLMTHAPKLAPESPTPQARPSPRNSISSPNSGSLNSLLDKIKRNEQVGVTRESPVITPQGNQLTTPRRDRTAKKLSLTEKDEKDITDAIRKIESSVSQNLTSRPASFTSKSFFQLKSRFEKGIFGTSRRISSPDLLSAGKKAESRRMSGTMADVESPAFDGVNEVEHEASANNNDTEVKQYQSEQSEETNVGKITNGSETQDGDLLGDEVLQPNAAVSATDETDNAELIGGLVSMENAASYSDDLLGGPLNGSETCQEAEMDKSPFDPFSMQDQNVEDVPLEPFVAQEPNGEDTSTVGGRNVPPSSEEEASLLESPPLEETRGHPEVTEAADVDTPITSETTSEPAEDHDGSEGVVVKIDEPPVESSPAVIEPELTPEVESEKIVEPQEEETPEVKIEEVIEPEKKTPEAEVEGMRQSEERTPEVEIEGDMQPVENTPEDNIEGVIQPDERETPEVRIEECDEPQEEETDEEHRVAEEVNTGEPPTRQEDEAKEIDKVGGVVEAVEEVSTETVTDETTTHTQTQEVKKEEQIEQVPVEAVETTKEKVVEEVQVEETDIKKASKSETAETKPAAATTTRPKSPPKVAAAPAVKTSAAKKPASGARPPSPTKPAATKAPATSKLATAKPPSTSKLTASKAPAKFKPAGASTSVAKKPSMEPHSSKKPGTKPTNEKTEPAKKPERPKSAASAHPTPKPLGPARPTSAAPKKAPVHAKAPGQDIKDGAAKSSTARPASAKAAPQRTREAAGKPTTTKLSRPTSAKPIDTKDGADDSKKLGTRPQSAKPKATAPTTTVKKTTTVTTTKTTTQSGTAPVKTQTTKKTVTEEKNGQHKTSKTTVKKEADGKTTTTKTVKQEKNGQHKTTKTTVKKEAGGKTTVREITRTSAARPASAAEKAIAAKPSAADTKSKPGAKPAAGGKPTTKPTSKKANGTPKEKKEEVPEKAVSPTNEETTAAAEDVKGQATPPAPPVEATPDSDQAEQETEPSEPSTEEVVEQSEEGTVRRTITETVITDGEEQSVSSTAETVMEQEQGLGES